MELPTRLSKEFMERNAAFQAASPAEKRVMVAKDVLAQLHAESIRARQGTWVRLTIPGVLEGNYLEDAAAGDVQVCEVIGQEWTSCDVCGLGALMISLVRFQDKVSLRDVTEKVFDYDIDEEATVGLSTVFNKEQLKLIELAFEGGGGYYIVEYDEETDEEEPTQLRAENFRESNGIDIFSEDDNKALIAIMKNIIENNGEFVP